MRVSTGANTLGRIAREYNVHIKTLWALINAYPELKAQIELHTKDCQNKGSKILPPLVVNNIFTVLGDP